MRGGKMLSEGVLSSGLQNLLSNNMLKFIETMHGKI